MVRLCSNRPMIYVLPPGILVRIWCGFCSELPHFAALSC